MGSIAYRAAVAPAFRTFDFAALSPAERAKVYREFSEDARRHGEHSIEPYQSLCFKIAAEFESLAAAVEAKAAAADACNPERAQSLRTPT